MDEEIDETPDPDHDEDWDPNGPITCWCGAVGTYDELFDDDFLDESCGGTGQLNCYCGGDSCVCHNHGSTECPGCEDCESDDWRDEYDDYEDQA